MKTRTSQELLAHKCLPCEGGVEPATTEYAQAQLSQLDDWQLSDDGKMIFRKWKLKDFASGMQLLQLAAEIAEAEQHHPDFHLTGYRLVRIDLTTHAIGGLSENDFILAAKIDAAAKALG